MSFLFTLTPHYYYNIITIIISTSREEHAAAQLPRGQLSRFLRTQYSKFLFSSLPQPNPQSVSPLSDSFVSGDRDGRGRFLSRMRFIYFRRDRRSFVQLWSVHPVHWRLQLATGLNGLSSPETRAKLQPANNRSSSTADKDSPIPETVLTGYGNNGMGQHTMKGVKIQTWQRFIRTRRDSLCRIF